MTGMMHQHTARIHRVVHAEGTISKSTASVVIFSMRSMVAHWRVFRIFCGLSTSPGSMQPMVNKDGSKASFIHRWEIRANTSRNNAVSMLSPLFPLSLFQWSHLVKVHGVSVQEEHCLPFAPFTGAGVGHLIPEGDSWKPRDIG